MRARLLFDGGAYASSSTAVIANAATQACGPYAVPNAGIDATVAYTNNPPCGAMRGFGAPQVAIAYEAQMDRLAERLGLDPVELRIRNALATGHEMPTGQRVPGPVDAEALLLGVRELPLPAEPGGEDRGWPGGAFGTTEGEGVRRARGLRVRVQERRPSRRASTTTRLRACGCPRPAASRWRRSTAPPRRWARGWWA